MSSGMDSGKADPAGSGAAEGERSMSLLGGIARAEVPGADDVEFLDGPKTKPKLSRGTLLILGVVGFAIMSIFLMRITTRGETVSAVTTEMQAHIEEALSKIQSKDMAPNDPLALNNVNGPVQGPRLRGRDRRVHRADPTIHQVPIEYIQKNPFELPQVKSAELTIALAAPRRHLQEARGRVPHAAAQEHRLHGAAGPSRSSTTRWSRPAASWAASWLPTSPRPRWCSPARARRTRWRWTTRSRRAGIDPKRPDRRVYPAQSRAMKPPFMRGNTRGMPSTLSPWRTPVMTRGEWQKEFDRLAAQVPPGRRPRAASH